MLSLLQGVYSQESCPRFWCNIHDSPISAEVEKHIQLMSVCINLLGGSEWSGSGLLQGKYEKRLEWVAVGENGMKFVAVGVGH